MCNICLMTLSPLFYVVLLLPAFAQTLIQNDQSKAALENSARKLRPRYIFHCIFTGLGAQKILIVVGFSIYIFYFLKKASLGLIC